MARRAPLSLSGPALVLHFFFLLKSAYRNRIATPPLARPPLRGPIQTLYAAKRWFCEAGMAGGQGGGPLGASWAAAGAGHTGACTGSAPFPTCTTVKCPPAPATLCRPRRSTGVLT